MCKGVAVVVIILAVVADPLRATKGGESDFFVAVTGVVAAVVYRHY